MSAWFADGSIFAAILALTVAEAGVLIVWHWRSGRGLAPLDVIFHLAAGAFLLLAAWLALRVDGLGLRLPRLLLSAEAAARRPVGYTSRAWL